MTPDRLARRTDGVLPYVTTRRPLPWRPFLFGVAVLPSLYLLVYVMLRLCGVYRPFYNQGGWEIDGTTRIYFIDVTFLPATIIEADCQNRLRWLHEPAGG